MYFCNGKLYWEVTRFFTLYMFKSELINLFQEKQTNKKTLFLLHLLTCKVNSSLFSRLTWLRNVQSARVPAPWEFISNQPARPLGRSFRVEWHCIRTPLDPIFRVNTNNQPFFNLMFLLCGSQSHDSNNSIFVYSNLLMNFRYTNAEQINKSWLLPFIDFKYEYHTISPLKSCWMQESWINKNSNQLIRPTLCRTLC